MKDLTLLQDVLTPCTALASKKQLEQSANFFYLTCATENSLPLNYKITNTQAVDYKSHVLLMNIPVCLCYCYFQIAVLLAGICTRMETMQPASNSSILDQLLGLMHGTNVWRWVVIC